MQLMQSPETVMLIHRTMVKEELQRRQHVVRSELPRRRPVVRLLVARILYALAQRIAPATEPAPAINGRISIAH